MGTICAKSKPPRVNQVVQEMPENQSPQIPPSIIILSQPEIQVNQSNRSVPKKKSKIRDTVKAVTTKTEDGVKMLNDYVFDEFLGQGAFGKVKLAYKRQSGQEKKFAIKILKKSKLKRQREYIKDANGAMVIKDALQDVRREIAVMKKIRHQNLIQLFEVIDNPNNDKLFMVLEFASKGQLIEWDDDEQIFYKINEDQEITETFLIQIFRDCIKGLYYLHQNGIVHRDLKPQNVLLSSDNTAKIADFGVSQIMGENDKLGNTQGTYHFMPPEACDKDKVKDGYSGKAADIWALGVTFYAFAFLKVPFNGDNVPDMLNNIINQTLEFPNDGSEGMKDFLRFLLNKDATKRPKIAEIAQHPYLNSNQSSLIDEINNEQLQKTTISSSLGVSDQEIEQAYSLSSIMRIKSWATKWRTSSNLKKSTFQQESSLKPQSPPI